ELWAGGKGDALREHGASVYVGDHIGDMVGAVAADAYPIGVLTGPCDEDQLRAAGAREVMPDLTGFPQWLSGGLPALPSGPPGPARPAAAPTPAAPGHPRNC